MQFNYPKLKGYKYLEDIGRGGQGKVVKVEDPSGRRVYALKLLELTQMNRVEEEIKALKELTHPHIIPVKDAGFSDKGAYILMEYMKHGNIQEYIKKNNLSIEEKLLLIQDTADALEYVHKEGFIHRDIKPQNIFVTSEKGKAAYACLGDFGIVKKIQSETETEGGKGTKLYLPLEVLKGEVEHSKESDIYSLGMTMYIILSGEHPCKSEIDYIQHLGNNIYFCKPSQREPQLNSNIDEICLRSISKNREERFKSVKEFSRELEKCIKSYDEEDRKSDNKIVVSDTGNKSDESVLKINKNNTSDAVLSAKELCEKGNQYYYGLENIKSDYEKAKECYGEAAEMGSGEALCNLGHLYQRGNGVEKDSVKARFYYKQAVERGYELALEVLAELYKNGLGVTQNYVKARAYYEESAERGNIHSLIELGLFYQNGYGVEIDYEKANEYYEEAVVEAVIKGDSNSLYNLGFLFENGFGVKKNYEKAKEYYEQGAKLGCIRAMYALGKAYHNGRGVGKINNEQAKICFEKAIAKGNIESISALGELYYLGQGIKKNVDKALELFRKASEYNNGLGKFYMGKIYRNGDGVEKNLEKAEEYFRRSLLLLEALGASGEERAFEKLAEIYEYGYDAVKIDYEKVKIYREKAAILGDSIAMYNLGWMYVSGRGVETDDVEAVKWYRKSAELGNRRAMLMLGLMYSSGHGVETDDVEAVKWYRKSAELGHPEAMFKLGSMYEEGHGVEQNYAEALKWYKRSADLGYQFASSYLSWKNDSAQFS